MKISSSRLTLLRMLSTSMPSARRLREQLIEILLLGDIGLERVLVDPPQHKPGNGRRRVNRHCAC